MNYFVFNVVFYICGCSHRAAEEELLSGADISQTDFGLANAVDARYGLLLPLGGEQRHGCQVPAGPESVGQRASRSESVPDHDGSRLAKFKSSGCSRVCFEGVDSESVSGSVPRSRSQLAGVVTGCLVLLCAAVLTPLFAALPKFVLSAIVISSIVPLIAFGEAKHLWKVSAPEELPTV